MYPKKYHKFCFVPIITFFTVCFLLSNSLAVEKKPLVWGSTSTTSGIFMYFTVASKVLNERLPEINITIRSTGASVHNTRLLEKKEIDLALSDTQTAADALYGKGSFVGKPYDGLRLLHVIHLHNPMHFVVSEKSGVKGIYELEGKPFIPGMLGSAAERTTMEIFRVFGVKPKLRHSSYADAVEAMNNGTVIGFGKYGWRDSSIFEVMAVQKIRILSFTDEQTEKIVKNVPGVMKAVIPAGAYPGIGEVKTVQNQLCTFVGKDFPIELAYKIVNQVWQNRNEIKKSYEAFAGDQLIEETLKAKTAVYLHPGAIKYYRELGYMVPKSLVPPEMEGK
jgi:TRAP transporter TAXI family solute receptor